MNSSESNREPLKGSRIRKENFLPCSLLISINIRQSRKKLYQFYNFVYLKTADPPSLSETYCFRIPVRRFGARAKAAMAN